MFNFFRRKTKTEAPAPQFTEEQHQHHYELKKQALERILGSMHDHVFHAIVPFCVGGGVDLYCFHDGIPGAAFATMELIAPDGTGPKPTPRGTYELVAFTRHRPSRAQSDDKNDHYLKMVHHFNALLTIVGRYSAMAVLGPNETCEVPWKDDEPRRCLILDAYDPQGVGFTIGTKRHWLLLCIEIHRAEMDYARAHGGEILLTRLKQHGVYPYSDLDRKLVV